MSKDTYDRAIAREAKIWENPQVDKLTAMGQPNQATTIETELFLLDQNRIHQDIYAISDIETEAINKLDIMLGISLDRINSDSLNLIAKIASKRVVMSYEYLIKQKKLDVKAYANTVSLELMTAKIAALTVDEAELATLQMRVNLYQQETALKIQELQAKISEEGLLLAEAAVDVIKAELDVLSEQNSIAKEILRSLSVQIGILDVLYQIAETVLKKVEIEAEEIGIDSAIKRTTIAGYRLTTAQKQLFAETDAIARRLTAELNDIALKSASTNAELAGESDYYSVLLTYMVAEIAVQQMRATIHSMMEQLSVNESLRNVNTATDVANDERLINQEEISKLEAFVQDDDNLLNEEELALSNELSLALDVAKVKTAAGFTSAIQYQLAYGGMADPGSPVMPTPAE